MIGLRLGFIGAGQMARAIGLSLIQKGVLMPNQVTVSSPEAAHLDIWKDYGCNTTFENGEVLSSSNHLIWAVKPQSFNNALKEAGKISNNVLQQEALHISVMAGIPLSSFASSISDTMKSTNIRAARVMANIAMQVGTGISVYTLAENCIDNDNEIIVKIFSTLGLAYKVPEHQINAYCGMFASGLGFMFPILEALSDGGVKLGIPRDISIEMAAQVMKGAGELILKEKLHPGVMKDRVCSAGGTTIAGVSAMEAGGVRNALIQAIEAAANRGNELDETLM